jgi:arylformamidase
VAVHNDGPSGAGWPAGLSSPVRLRSPTGEPLVTDLKGDDVGLESMRVLDLSQDFSMHTPAFASYDGPSIKWVKRLAFDKVGGQEITSTLHVGTHLDGPVHFWSAGKTIGELPLPWLVGSAVVVDLERMGVGDYQLYGPEHFERWERETGLRVERDDILIIHTGYHRFYNENWVDRSQVDETRYFVRHPGPTREFAEWVLDRGVRWLAVDAGSADHPMNTVIRKIRPDEAEDAEAALGRPLDELFPKQDLQIMHTLLFPHDVIHIENLGGQIDEVLDRRIHFGCFPWKFVGGEAAFCRAVAFLEE